MEVNFLTAFIDGAIYSITFTYSTFTGILAAIGMVLHEFPRRYRHLSLVNPRRIRTSPRRSMRLRSTCELRSARTKTSKTLTANGRRLDPTRWVWKAAARGVWDSPCGINGLDGEQGRPKLMVKYQVPHDCGVTSRLSDSPARTPGICAVRSTGHPGCEGNEATALRRHNRALFIENVFKIDRLSHNNIILRILVCCRFILVCWLEMGIIF